jgi:creatinine amidohydrolase
MTFLEFRDRMAEDPVVILPLGSTEVQGPRGPMGDFLLATALADRIAESSGAIVAPTIPFGVAEVFRDVPGGVQLRAETFRGLLHDVITAFLDHGLNRLLVFNGHTGNHAAIGEVIRDLRRERGVIIPWLNIWPMVGKQVLEKAFSDNAARASGHGAAIAGSVYKYFFPTLYRDDIDPPPEPPRSFLGLPTKGLASIRLADTEIFVPINMLDHCTAVVSGDATLATAEAGRIIADHIVTSTIAVVEHLKKVAHT